MELFQNSGSENGFTITDLVNYEKLRDINFTQYEIDMLLLCKAWARKTITELRKD